MRFKPLLVGFTAFTSVATAAPAGSNHNRNVSHGTGHLIPRVPLMIIPGALPPITLEVKPDGTIQVAEIQLQSASNLTDRKLVINKQPENGDSGTSISLENDQIQPDTIYEVVSYDIKKVILSAEEAVTDSVSRDPGVQLLEDDIESDTARNKTAGKLVNVENLSPDMKLIERGEATEIFRRTRLIDSEGRVVRPHYYPPGRIGGHGPAMFNSRIKNNTIQTMYTYHHPHNMTNLPKFILADARPIIHASRINNMSALNANPTNRTIQNLHEQNCTCVHASKPYGHVVLPHHKQKLSFHNESFPRHYPLPPQGHGCICAFNTTLSSVVILHSHNSYNHTVVYNATSNHHAPSSMHEHNITNALTQVSNRTLMFHPDTSSPDEIRTKEPQVISSRDVSAGRSRKPAEPRFFDNRPTKYIGGPLSYTSSTNMTDRLNDLSELRDLASVFNRLDDGRYYGNEKWFLLQRFNLGTLPSGRDDNHEDVQFLQRLFHTSAESIRWFSNAMTMALNVKENDPQWSEYTLYKPLDHFNWIRKAHSILGKMTAAEQKSVNDRIDDIHKLSPKGLLALYQVFEVYPDMLEEHQMQAAEFFQVAKIVFPQPGISNTVKSTRGPVQLRDWNDNAHPRHRTVRPVDALARYAIPATDSNHDDWTFLTAVKLAHERPEKQREWRDRVRMMHVSLAPTPRDLKDFYDMLNVDWQGKDDDRKKAEVAEKLCVRELVFAEQPKKGIWPNKWNWSRVPQQPAMVNVCTEEQREERLKELFFIERWDSEHKNPLQLHQRDVEIPRPGPISMVGEIVDDGLVNLISGVKYVADAVVDEIKTDATNFGDFTIETLNIIGTNVYELGEEVATLKDLAFEFHGKDEAEERETS